MKGQLPGRLFPQVYQEGGVHHWHRKTALSHTLPHRDVGRGALVVALTKKNGDQSTRARRCCRRPKEEGGENLAGHPTPEVGISRPGIQHWGDDCLILVYEIPEDVWVGE